MNLGIIDAFECTQSDLIETTILRLARVVIQVGGDDDQRLVLPCAEDVGQAGGELAAAGQVSRAQRDPDHPGVGRQPSRSEEHTSELQSQSNLVCRLLLEKKKQ